MLDIPEQRIVRIVRAIGFFLLIIQINDLLSFFVTSYSIFFQCSDKVFSVFLATLFLKYFVVILQSIGAVYLVTSGRFIVRKSMSLIPKTKMENDDLIVWGAIRSIGLITLGLILIQFLSSLVYMFYHAMFFRTYELSYIDWSDVIYIIQLAIISFYLLKKGKAIFSLITR